MSNNLADIAGEEYEWLVEVKKSYDLRHLLEMQLKLDDSDTDKAIWEEIYLIDEAVEQLIEIYKDSDQKEDWMDEWEKCTPEFVMKKFHRTRAWEDLKIGFSHHDINIIRCHHPVWGQEFHAKNDFIKIPLIKYDVDEKMDVTSEVYEIMRYFASKEKIADEMDEHRSAVNRANKLLTSLFKLSENPITGKTNPKDKIKYWTSKILFSFLD